MQKKNVYQNIQKLLKGLFIYKKYQDEALDILIHDTVNINQKLGPFYILNDETLHKWAKYLTQRISKKDPNNQQVLQDFFKTYGKGEKKDNNLADSLQDDEVL